MTHEKRNNSGVLNADASFPNCDHLQVNIRAIERPLSVRCTEWMGEWQAVPEEIAKCPDCGAPLEAWNDGWSGGMGYSVEVQCSESEDQWHECLQSDWQPVMDAVKAWANQEIRLLSGNCQVCGKEVKREQTAAEILTGKQETNWR